MEHNFPINCWLHMVTWCQCVQYRRGIKSNLQCRNLTNTILARWSRSTWTIISHFVSLFSWCEVWEWHFTSLAFFPETQRPKLIMWKIIRQISIMKHSTKYLTYTLQDCQIIKKWKDWESKESTGKTLKKMLTKYNVIFWIKS